MTSKLRIATACLSLAAGTALAAIASPAQAFNFDSGTDLGSCGVLVDNLSTPLGIANLDDTTGVSTCTTADGFVLDVEQAADGYLQGKEVNGTIGVGITSENGPTLAEIGGEVFQEILAVTVPVPNVLTELGLSFLYHNPAFGDNVKEQGLVKVSETLYGILSVTSATTAEWVVYENGVEIISKVLNGDSTATGGGYYNIKNPFADIVVSSFTLLAPESTAGDTFRQSDFALTNASVGIPEPSLVLGLGVAGASLLGLRRRKNA